MGTKRKQSEAEMGDYETKNVIFPSSTISHQHSSSACVVRSIRNEKPLHYTLKIQAFSLLKDALASSRSKSHRFESQTFHAGGYQWKLALYPNGDETRSNGSDYISLYLVTVDDFILSTTKEVNAVFTFLVHDSLKDKYVAIRDGKVRRFSATKTEWGFEKLLSLDNFNDASNGFLIGDCCVFGVDISVMNCDGEGGGEVFSLIKEPKDYTFTWKVENFSRLAYNCYESYPFTVEGYRWRICLYPKGCSNSKSGYLSLFLVLDNLKQLPQGSQVYVDFEMAVVSQLGSVGPKKATFNYWFGFGGIEASGWGHPDFISLSDLEGPTKGFILNDTLVVQVKINVVSTLKKII